MTIHAKGYWLEISGPNTHTFDKPLCNTISEMFRPFIESAVDIGCGDGRYTRNLIDHGIDATGYDGSPLTPQISGGLCGVKDFADPQDIGKFDLVLSLEVGEHIPREWEQVFIENLCNTANKFICLSWAVEGQLGYGHFNCRNNDYVISEMQKRGFVFDGEASFALRNASDKIKFPWFENTIMVFCRQGQSLLPEKYSTMKLRDVFKGYESSLVSVVLTSCGRLDCLKRTIETFNKFNTFPIHEFIICEDSASRAMHDELKKLYPDYTLVLHKKNVGLVANIDSGYSRVKTPYVMHLEDDWEFNRGGFIEKSLDILLAYPKIMQVWIRALNDTNGHPIEDRFYKIDDTDFLLVSLNGVGGAWHGFTWNPGLRRISDWEKVGPFDKICPNLKAGEREMYVGIEFFSLGYRAAILPEGYCFHIGYQPKNYTLL